MTKIVQWARLALVRVCVSRKANMLASAAALVLVSIAAPVPAQQPSLASTSEDGQLREKCLRWFNNKRYVGVIKNSDHPRYRARREVTLTTAVEDNERAEIGRPLCIVKVRSEDDGHQVILRDYIFDGSVAKWKGPYSNASRVWLALTPQGACLRYEGALPVYGTVYNAGEAQFCP